MVPVSERGSPVWWEGFLGRANSSTALKGGCAVCAVPQQELRISEIWTPRKNRTHSEIALKPSAFDLLAVS